MGQAKSRGTREERVAQAERRRIEEARDKMLRDHRMATRLADLARRVREEGVDAVAAEVTEIRGMTP